MVVLGEIEKAKQKERERVEEERSRQEMEKKNQETDSGISDSSSSSRSESEESKTGGRGTKIMRKQNVVKSKEFVETYSSESETDMEGARKEENEIEEVKQGEADMEGKT